MSSLSSVSCFLKAMVLTSCAVILASCTYVGYLNLKSNGNKKVSIKIDPNILIAKKENDSDNSESETQNWEVEDFESEDISLVTGPSCPEKLKSDVPDAEYIENPQFQILLDDDIEGVTEEEYLIIVNMYKREQKEKRKLAKKQRRTSKIIFENNEYFDIDKEDSRTTWEKNRMWKERNRNRRNNNKRNRDAYESSRTGHRRKSELIVQENTETTNDDVSDMDLGRFYVDIDNTSSFEQLKILLQPEEEEEFEQDNL